MDHLRKYNGNSGIQRVTRMIAKSLFEDFNCQVIPVKWEDKKIKGLLDKEYINIEMFNGPKLNKNKFVNFTEGDVLFIPELLSYLNGHDWKKLHAFIKKKKLKVFILIHDLIPIRQSIHYPKIVTKLHHKYLLNSMKFNGLFPISKYTASDFKNYFNLRYKLNIKNIKNKLVPLSLSGEIELYKSKLNSKISDKRDKPTKNLLCVTSIEPRKNLEPFLQAMTLLNSEKKNSFKLTIVGRCLNEHYLSKLKKYFKIENNIYWLNEISQNRIIELYSSCDLVIYPPLLEGFGLPVIEAHWHKKPTLTHNSNVFIELREKLGESCNLVDMTNVTEIYKKLLFILNNPNYLKNLSKNININKLTTWKDYTKNLLENINELRKKN